MNCLATECVCPEVKSEGPMHSGSRQDEHPSSAQMMREWRRLIARRRHVAERCEPRPFAAIGYVTHGAIKQDRCIDLHRLALFALYDERLSSGNIVTRLIGVSGRLESEGLRFGGPELIHFDKDLRLPPMTGGRGKRIDSRKPKQLAFALALERYLGRCAAHCYMPRRRMPAFPSTCSQSDRRVVDLSRVPKRQVVAITSVHDLCGQSGTTQFDFIHSRFRVGS